jgi:hypothetical protein
MCEIRVMADVDIATLSLQQLLDHGARGEINGHEIESNPEAMTPEGLRFLATAFLTEERFLESMFGSNARGKLLHRCVRARDPEILAILFRIVDDEGHPLHDDALDELLYARDAELVAPLRARIIALLDTENLRGLRHRRVVDAVARMGTDAVLRELVPRYLKPDLVMRDAGSQRAGDQVVRVISEQLGSKRVDPASPELAAVIVSLAGLRPMGNCTREFLRLMDKDVVSQARAAAAEAAAAAAKPVGKPAAKVAPSKPVKKLGPGATYLQRYEAGQHDAVWKELRALGPKVRTGKLEADARAVAKATMKALGDDVEAIAKVLKKAKYKLLKKAVRPAKPDAAVKLAALAKLVGPLPLALEVFYETFDGISLAQDVDAEIDDSPLFGGGVLDELGTRDPLVVASLADVLADAKAQKKQGALPLLVYVGPDPACKGTVDDEIPDENPVRVGPSTAIDAELAGGDAGFFVDWLRAYVAAGGFRGELDQADRAHLTAVVKPF